MSELQRIVALSENSEPLNAAKLYLKHLDPEVDI